MAIDPYLREGAFMSEATAAMGDAFEAACNELQLAKPSNELRTLIATLIVAAARKGDIDPVRLRMKAVVGVFNITPLMDPNRNVALRRDAQVIKRPRRGA
jgi:hypothetical protein